MARRGADRPLLIGRDSSGVRRLTTAGAGLWRWALRGGAAREAYRALVAGGVDWLLDTEAVRGGPPLTGAAVTSRGLPVVFRWSTGEIPDSVVVNLDRGDTTVTDTLRFDARGVAVMTLATGIYRWTAPAVSGAQGTLVVEEYSDEFHPGAATLTAGTSESRGQLVVRRAREGWWLFAIAMLAFIGEWGWRQRRGLP